jgi:hypothetical protein
MVAMIRDFTPQHADFFVDRRPGRRSAPAKRAARAQVLRLRAAGHSVTEIEQALAGGPTPPNRTGVWELPREEGYERLPPRPAAERGAPRRDHPPRTRLLGWPQIPTRLASDYAGVLLLIPGLVALDLTGAVAAARFPGTREVPALSSVLSLPALKAIGRRRVSHVDDVATDPALAAFAGLESLPKATALGTYSYRLARRHDQALLGALAPAMTRTGQASGAEFDLDFHAIMHYGDDVALEQHYVPRRSQRTESVLTFFAQDGQHHNLVYANATCTKAGQAGEALAFARHWQQATGRLPELLVFDSKVTTGAGLLELDRAGIGFLTLHPAGPQRQAHQRIGGAARRRLDHHHPGPARPLPPPPGPRDAGDRARLPDPLAAARRARARPRGAHPHPHQQPNNRHAKPAWLVDRYAKRMTIEQRLAEQVRAFHPDALSSAVALNIDLDTTLTVWAAAAYDALRQCLPGYHTATPDTIWRRFVSTRGHLTLGPTEVVARLARRTYSPVLRSADLPDVEVPWWGGRRLRYELA